MYVVTGGAGFIGSNLVRGLNKRGIRNILVVDDLTQGIKFKNLVDCDFSDYIDKDDFINNVKTIANIQAIFHQGACSNTTEWDGQFMMKNNYDYSKKLLHHCLNLKIPFIYASSAAVYGDNKIFQENPNYEQPLNVYGYSKLQFDRYARHYLSATNSQVVGLRYFNVYGRGEQHKESMASVIWHFHNQLLSGEQVNLFEGCDGYQHGDQRRDFIYVQDIINVNLWFLDHPQKKGIFNVGTGISRSFNEAAQAVINWHNHGSINYIPFPNHLKNHYQSFTEADITQLRDAGYMHPFTSLEQGVKEYLNSISPSLVRLNLLGL